jgi:hypothetical protein
MRLLLSNTATTKFVDLAKPAIAAGTTAPLLP